MIKSCRNHRNKTRNFYQATKRKRRKGDPKFFFSIALLFIARHKPATNSNSRNDSFEFFYSKEEKKGGESGEYWPFLWLHWPASPRASFENLAPPISCPPLSLIPREMAAAPPSKKLLVSPWQIFNSTATWKNRILPMVASQRHDPARPLIPHPAISATWGGGRRVSQPSGPPRYTRSWEILFRPRRS